MYIAYKTLIILFGIVCIIGALLWVPENTSNDVRIKHNENYSTKECDALEQWDKCQPLQIRSSEIIDRRLELIRLYKENKWSDQAKQEFENLGIEHDSISKKWKEILNQ